jgi:hydroxypyruvate reductase
MQGDSEMDKLYKDARTLIDKAIEANLPEEAVRNALKSREFSKNIYLVAIGKAAWRMANSACEVMKDKIKGGIVITKYEHSLGEIPGIEIFEAGHPISDENTILATQKAVNLAQSLGEDDELLFLVSGGGSALFELPLAGLELAEVVALNNELLACGADIVEINMIRKRLSSVKAGRFAKLCSPAKVFAVVLSDILGDRLDSIASGPAAPDLSTAEDVLNVLKKYDLNPNEKIMEYLKKETPKELDNVDTVITGSVRILCESTANIAKELGYTPYLLATEINCEARDAGRMISAIAKQINLGNCAFKRPCAVIFGGETVVKVKGSGKGGRNQELVLAAAEGISGIKDMVIFSVGSDGTDGPTDAAGGIVDGATMLRLKEKGLSYTEILENNDAYNGLAEIGGLIITGPTGTNVNDVTVILCG